MPTAENPSLKPKQDDFLTIIRRQQLGKLKVYLGACAGGFWCKLEKTGAQP